LARVNAYAPGADAPCLECAWSKTDYDQIEQQYLCGGDSTGRPNGAPAELGALAAAMLAVECRKMLAGEFDCALVGRQATLNARWHRLAVTIFRRNSGCRFDHGVWNIERLVCDTDKALIADLLAMHDSVRMPGHRFVRRLVCSLCGNVRHIFRLASSIDASTRQCSVCGNTAMVSTGFDVVEALDGSLPSEIRSRTLHEAGLRYGDVIEAGDRHFEIAADVVISQQ
jgi:ribosomal protein S27E